LVFVKFFLKKKFFGCASGELKAKKFTYFDDSMKKNKISINILDVLFFYYECAVLPMRAKKYS
jgi:hypothetical protein